MLEKVKLALRLTVDAYDSELTDLIEAGKLDLGIAGVIVPQELDALTTRAIITYCKLHFMTLDDPEWAHIKDAYDEQKAQLSMATGHTAWG